MTLIDMCIILIFVVPVIGALILVGAIHDPANQPAPISQVPLYAEWYDEQCASKENNEQ